MPRPNNLGKFDEDHMAASVPMIAASKIPGIIRAVYDLALDCLDELLTVAGLVSLDAMVGLTGCGTGSEEGFGLGELSAARLGNS